MQVYILSFGRAADGNSSAKTAEMPAGKTEQVDRLSKAPPCFGYKDLRCVSSLKLLSTSLSDATTRKGINDYEADAKKAFQAVTELSLASKSSIDELFSARVTYMTETAKKKKADQR